MSHPSPLRPPLAAVAAPAALLAALLLPRPALAVPAWLGGAGGAVEVDVREVVANDTWEVTYQLPARAAGVELLRRRRAFRHEAWGVLPAGSSWTREGNVERLCFPSPTRTFAVSFRSDFAAQPKDYKVTLAFADGSRALYTGNLLLRPLATCDTAGAANATEEPPPLHRFRFATAPDRPLRVVDRTGLGALAWEPAGGHEETYALFGPAPAQESERATLVLDPALPAWVGDDLRALLPRLFERFAAETGMHLSVRPLVLLAFDPRGSGLSFSGGVLDGVLAMHASGDGWQHGNEEARRYWFLRLAHEAFHFWGGAELLADDESEWLSEAAAELFALRAAWAFEVVDYVDYETLLVDAANQCLAGLAGASLLSAPERGAYDTWYDCGTVILFVADRAIERATPGTGGIARLFRELFAEGRLAGNRYGTSPFLGWLDKLSGDRETVFALQRLIRRGVERRADDFVHGLLVQAGVPVSLVPPQETAGDPTALGTLLRRGLTRCACGTSDPAAAADEGCARFAPGQRIASVGGVDPRIDLAGAYARLQTAVQLAQPLAVATGDEPARVTLLCPRDSLEPSLTRLLRLDRVR